MEYPIWGIPPGKTEETLLYTRATTMPEALGVKRMLERQHGCTAVRIQELDLSVNDVQKMFRRSVRI